MTRVSSEVSTQCYQVDENASQFMVKAFASGLISVIAHSPSFTTREICGQVTFNPTAVESSSVKIAISPFGLRLRDEVTNEDRNIIETVMHKEVLESARYPRISFDSRIVSAARLAETLYRFTISGDLHLHGITRQVTLYAQTVIDGDTIRAIGDFTILQSDFGMNTVSIAGSTLTIKDELRLGFFIVARRKP